MAGLFDVTAALHRIKVKLYPSRLSRFAGRYVARTLSESTLSIEQICRAAHERGGYTGGYADMVKCAHLFLDEAFYQLGDSFAVNLKYFSVHPRVGGTFDEWTRGVPAERPPIGFRFRAREPLRRLENRIEVFVVGAAGAEAAVREFHDIATDTVNEKVTPGGLFTLTGRMIKIRGDPRWTGLYFTVPDRPSEAVRVTALADNQRSKIAGMIPPLPAGKTWTLEARTQYTSSGKPLKEPRVIRSDFTLAT